MRAVRACVPFKAVTPTLDFLSRCPRNRFQRKGTDRGPGNGDCHPRRRKKNARRALHDDTYRSIPRVARCQKGLGRELREAELSWPNTDPQRSGCPRRRSFSQRAVCCPPFCVSVCSPSPSCCSLILALDASLQVKWLLPTRQAAQPCRPVMKRGSSSGTARMLAQLRACHPASHSMQPIDKASSESNLRESRRGLKVMR